MELLLSFHSLNKFLKYCRQFQNPLYLLVLTDRRYAVGKHFNKGIQLIELHYHIFLSCVYGSLKKTSWCIQTTLKLKAKRLKVGKRT
jgi:hypothetical protein